MKLSGHGQVVHRLRSSTVIFHYPWYRYRHKYVLWNVRLYNCTYIYIDRVLAKHCVWRHLCVPVTLWTVLSKEKASTHHTRGYTASVHVRKRIIVRCLGPTIIFNGCRLNGLFTVATEKCPERRRTSEHRQPHTLRFGKCL